jgi:hypothetical protein
MVVWAMYCASLASKKPAVVIIDANNILKTYIVRAISMHTDIHMNNRDARSVLHACPADSAQGRRQLAAAD